MQIRAGPSWLNTLLFVCAHVLTDEKNTRKSAESQTWAFQAPNCMLSLLFFPLKSKTLQNVWHYLKRIMESVL